MKKRRRNKPQPRKPSERELLPDIDLHDLHPEIALGEMESFIEQAHRDGLRKVLVIHGKGMHGDGTGTLRRRVRTKLEQLKYVADFNSAEPYQGGDGATIVIFR